MPTLKSLVLTLAALAAAPLAAQPSPLAQASPPEARPAASGEAPPSRSAVRDFNLAAIRMEPNAVEFDGRLDEAAWQSAPVASGFTQRGPNPGAPATEQTEARVLYDADAVYVGMRMYDRQPDAIDARLARRDEGVNSDWALVAFDSHFDRQTAFVFAVNPAGVLRDLLVYEDVREDDSWDAVWDAKVSRDASGWTAEFRIPLSQLRYTADVPVQSWGLQFGRDIKRTGESAFWAPMLPENDGMVRHFGTLTDLRDLRAPRSLELQPYVASSITRAPGDASNPYYSETDAQPRIGLDLKYGLTSDVTLTATVNPDFGQVEADPAQVYLGGFEQSFSERRPFFVEGTDVFNMSPRRFLSMNRPSLLYTRRIGRSPRRGSFVPDDVHDSVGEQGAVYTDAPQQTTILGAAKLSGRVGPFSVGVLNAITSREYGRFEAFDASGQPLAAGEALVEPLTNYAVARARGTFGGTTIGGLLTSVIREEGASELADFLPRQATVAGLDLGHTLSEQWVVNGQIAGSLVTGSPEAISRLQTAFPRLYQRPDAGHLSLDDTRTSLSGMTAEVNLLKPSGEHWAGGVQAQMTSPGFDANELGFQSRADNASVGGVVVYQQNEPQGAFQNWSTNVFSGAAWNFDGNRIGTFTGGNASAQLRNFWGGNLHWEASLRTDNDRETRGGPLARDPAGFNLNGNFYTDSRKAVSSYLWSGTNRNELGSWYWGVETGIEARPTDAVSFSIGPALDLSHTDRQYITAFDEPAMTSTFGRRYVFGELDQTSISLVGRLNWTFTPDLSLQLYARPFVSRGQYDRFKQMTEPGQLHFPVFGEDTAGAVSRDASGEVTIDPQDGGDSFSLAPDFTFRSLQGNAVLRWEYRPGSTLFLVWQQQRSGFEQDGDLRFGRDVQGLFRDELTNVFLIKLSYWLG